MTEVLLLMTLAELVALLNTLDGFEFADFTYDPFDPDEAWNTTLYFANATAQYGYGDSIEEATFMAWCAALKRK